MAVIAVDFDNTLFDLADDGEVELVDGAREAMIELKQLGHHLIIHTCRTTVARQDRSLAREVRWIEDTLAEHDIPYDEIYVHDKLIADAYIDDRAVAFKGDWTETLQDLETHLHGRRKNRAV